MPHLSYKFHLTLTAKAKKQLNALSPQIRQQYDKAFRLICSWGPGYRSLRTHRYEKRGWNTWGSSASMSLRFYWHYTEEQSILVTALDSH